MLGSAVPAVLRAGAHTRLDSAIVIGANSTAEAGGTLEVCSLGLCDNLAMLGSFDLAAAFGDMLHAIAQGGNFLTDIVP